MRAVLNCTMLLATALPVCGMQNEPDFPSLQSTEHEDPMAPFRIGSSPLEQSSHVHPSGAPGESEMVSQTASSGDETLHPESELPEEAEKEKVLQLFRAVIANDSPTLLKILGDGMHPDTALPPDPPQDFLSLLPNEQLHYYATSDQNLTPLMVAAALGRRDAAAILLQTGADRWQKTKRHKTYALWLASKTNDIELMRMLMNLDSEGEWARHKIRVDLTAQKMLVFNGSDIVLESPVSSGKKSKPTPPGVYVVTDKHREWTSTLYRVKMPYFIRLSCGDIGFHAGRLPGHPASSGCIRLPADKAKALFQLIPVGTLVEIE